MDVTDCKIQKSIADLENFFEILLTEVNPESQIWARRRSNNLLENLRNSLIIDTTTEILETKLPEELVNKIIQYIG